MSTEQLPISPLVADLITASLTMTQKATESVIDGLMAQIAWAEAREAAVHQGVMELLCGSFMPSTFAIERALYPSDELIEQYRAAKDGAS